MVTKGFTNGVKFGLEVLLEEKRSLLKGRKVGLITNHTGTSRRLESTIDIFANSPDFRLSALYGPEHGVRGDIQAGQKVDTYQDPKTSLPVFSLYGETKKPTPEMLSGVDILVFDIQDAGCRFYTYLYTMGYALEAGAENGLPILVLDRPNPINGEAVEGNILDLNFRSFVGNYPIPIRTGMTIGELALLFNNESCIGADLTVVPMKGWKRNMWFDETGLPFVPPSPNCPTLDSLTVYPGTCFFEGTNLSEGRGTTRPFEVVGAPWIDPNVLAAELNALGLPGVIFRPTYFAPTFSKHQGEKCGGVQVHVIDRNVFQPVITGLFVLQTARRQDTARFEWLQPAKHGTYFFDLLAGTDSLRRDLEEGRPVYEIISEWGCEQEEFQEVRVKYLLY